jgi:Undecaprenyl-phosphate galactose phosphotransferase WbaP
MVGSLIVTDGLALLLAVAISVFCKALFKGGLDITSYITLLPFLPVFFVAFGAVGLYSGIALIPPEELRRCTLCSAVVFLFLSITTVSMRGAHTFVKPTLFLAITLTAALVPVLRAYSRKLLSRTSWWGYPAVVFGSPESGNMMIELMLRDPGMGLKPVVVVHDGSDPRASIHGIPVVTDLDFTSVVVQPGTYAVVMPDINRDVSATLSRCRSQFSHILAMPELNSGISNLLVSPKAVGAFLGLEIRQRVLLPGNWIIKRTLDLVLTGIGGILILPLAIVIGFCVRLDSEGPVFYYQKRLGRGGKEFRAWKFRTMLQNADQILQEHLERNPELRYEWERDHKLKNDPRVTRVGSFLRKTSLDELPQLWNVLRGDMSLVGPRPIVHAEISRYGNSFSSYTSVPGGITGMWQVSGRSNTSYAERVSLDEYYVRNWSVWLDLYILCRTLGVVLLRKGAY